ncbi:MAG: aminotransferase class III-fold pyridoxal phosphate-dependent enzyme [Bacteroidota bacterium]
MKTFDVYPRYEIELVKGEGCTVVDQEGTTFLDLYGGHAVISIGHSHPHYQRRINEQLAALGFYSNSVQLPIQEELAQKIGEQSGYPDYSLFLCNSGAEAVENALKLASFHTGRKKIIAFEKGFHGRTSLAVAATDNAKIVAPANETDNIIRLPLNDLQAVEEVLDETIAGVIIEGILGYSGIYEPDQDFLQGVEKLCREHGAQLISDEIQSGYGRSGRFFAHQHMGVKPDLITMAKGMGNGFPIGGVLISPDIAPWPGMLGTTFGGNPLACAAGLAVLEVMEAEKLIENADLQGKYLMEQLKGVEGVKEIRGKGLMIGIELETPAAPLRKQLLLEYKIFTGSASNANTLRVLPPLSIKKEEIDQFLAALNQVISCKTLLQ